MITEMKAGHLKDIDKPSEPFEVIGKVRLYRGMKTRIGPLQNYSMKRHI